MRNLAFFTLFATLAIGVAGTASFAAQPAGAVRTQCSYWAQSQPGAMKMRKVAIVSQIDRCVAAGGPSKMPK
jgi:hypothetical protein